MEETPFQTARREAHEEIGLPELNRELPRPFTVEHLCELPSNLARTELVVRPCVALLHSYDATTGANEDPEVSLIPRLDAREVAAVFTAPFHNFLRSRDEAEHQIEGEDPEEWYQGAWTEWHQSNWRSKLVIHFRGRVERIGGPQGPGKINVGLRLTNMLSTFFFSASILCSCSG